MKKALQITSLFALAMLIAPQLAMAQSPAIQGINTNLALAQNPNLQLFKTEQENADFKAITSRYNNKIRTAFQDKPTLKATMESELRQIQAESNVDRKLALVEAYQAKHSATFKQVLTENKINLDDMTIELNSKIPSHNFSLNNSLNFKATPKFSTLGISKGSRIATIKSSKSKQSSPETLQTTIVKNLTSPDFTFSKHLGCGQVAGSEVSISGGYMTNKSAAIVAGGCSNTGEFKHLFTVADRQSVKVDMTYDLSAYSFATGIVGDANSISTAAVEVYNANTQVPPTLSSGDYSVYCQAFAVFLWVGSATCEVVGGKYSIDFDEPGDYKVIANTSTFQLAIIGGSYGEARIKKLRVTLTTSPK